MAGLRDDPVRLYASDDRRAIAGTVKQLREMLDSDEEVVLQGRVAVADWAEYQRRCGRIEATREAIAIFEKMSQEAQRT